MKVPNSQSRGNAFQIEMTPMIDMVFLLIVFFVWTSGMQVVESMLPSRVSEATGNAAAVETETPPPEADFDPVVVRVVGTDAATSWLVNNQPVGSVEELRGMLQKLVALKRDAPVILHPDAQVSLGKVIDLYDLTRRLGFETVQFAAE